jgi:hypothetical protein
MNPEVLFYIDNPVTAHDTFFYTYHTEKDAPFHDDIIRDWHSATPNVLTLAFRGSAKSTRAEEAITLMACFGVVKNVLILKESEQRAADSLKTIKHYLEYDEFIQDTFSIGPGEIWTETRILTSTGVMIQAYGRGQSLRGVKYLNARPDFIFLDDVEDKESGSVATPEARAKTKNWLAGTVIPSLAPGGRMRMAATPLHPEALAPTLAKAGGSWLTRTYPILYRDDDDPIDPGAWTSAWPDRWSLETILKMRKDFEEIGEGETFQQEYMCEAVDPASQTFTDDMLRVEPRVRSWHAVYAVYDPARTTNKKSATTGKVVASWIGNRLVVWEAAARKWMPDEIVNDIFATCEKYTPVAVGVEENGLNEWLLQPLRTRQLVAGQVIPLRPLRAPKGKLDFIRGLQPYFASHSVVFADHLPELRRQLLGFPTGDIDAPNALAYMLVMKLGVPVYDNFTEANIVAEAAGKDGLRSPYYLLVNSNNQVTTAAAVQQHAGQLRVLWDAIADGDPGTVLTDVIKDAQVALPSLGVSSLDSGAEAGKRSGLRDSAGTLRLRLLSSPRHFDEFTIYGLRAAARKAGYQLQRGGSPEAGREELRALFRRTAHGQPSISVHPDATWTLRALAGGYARDATSVLPIDNAYAVLMEPLESFAALTSLGDTDLADAPNYAYTSDGRRFISALVAPTRP